MEERTIERIEVTTRPLEPVYVDNEDKRLEKICVGIVKQPRFMNQVIKKYFPLMTDGIRGRNIN